jgi:hypothetical protein
MAQLASEHDPPPSMVRLVSHELAEKMLQVCRNRAGGNVNNDLAHDTAHIRCTDDRRVQSCAGFECPEDGH